MTDTRDDADRWRILAVVGTAVLLGMSHWFGANAVALQFRAQWGLTPGEGAWLTSVVPLGFVAGTALVAMLNLADIVPARQLFAWSAIGGATANLALLAAPGFATALGSRFLAGAALAGVYPPAMKMIATWFRERRGLAVGVVVGSLTVGKALPYLVHAIPAATIVPVVLSGSVAALVAAALVLARYRDGPFPFTPRPFSWGLVASVVGSRRWRVTTASYLGHMWELYAFWTWIPAWLAASAAARHSRANTDAIAFLVIAFGAAGCVWGGLASDRRGREWLVAVAMTVSGSCALAIGLVYGLSWWLVVPVALVWGWFVIADSAQFSVLVTESVDAHAVGTALTLQVCLGFLLTMVSMQLVPPVVEQVGWRWAFPMLALGPAAGVAAIRRLRVRESARPGGHGGPLGEGT